MSNQNKIRCNMCYWVGDEDELTLVKLDNDDPTKVDDEFIDACPNCKTDEYLMDIE